MKITRRNFLASAPVTVGAVVGLGSIARGQFAPRGANLAGDPLSRMTSTAFLPYVGTEFVFRTGTGREVRLRLNDLEVTTPENYVASGRGEELFSLKFHGPARVKLIQDSYAVEHFALGSFSLFITEAGTVDGGGAYEAIFNRLSH